MNLINMNRACIHILNRRKTIDEIVLACTLQVLKSPQYL